MTLRNKAVTALAVCAAVLSAVLRLKGNAAAPLLVALVSVAAVFLLCGFKPREARSAEGRTAVAMALFAAVTGVAMVVATVTDGLDLLKGIYPYPQPLAVTAINQLLLFAMLLGGFGGGVFFAVTGVRWFFDRQVSRVKFSGAALLPVAWMWARLFWYMTSFTSAVNRFRNINEVAMMLFEMLFFMVLARYVSGIEDGASRFAVPVAVCTAMLGVSACVVRFIALASKNAALFGATELIAAPDFMVALLAGAWAFNQLFGKGEALPEVTEESLEEEQLEELAAQAAEEEAEPFVINEDDFTLLDEKEDETPEEATEERKPLELEDILNDLMNENR